MEGYIVMLFFRRTSRDLPASAQWVSSSQSHLLEEIIYISLKEMLDYNIKS